MFCSIAAQRDNLGDIVIRQVFVDWISAPGARLRVFVGDMPAPYIEAFDLPAGTVLYRSSAAFEAALVARALVRRAHLAFAPGPLGLLPGRRTWPKSLANLLNAALVRLGGGEVVVLGRAVRGEARPARDLERLLARTTTVCALRDHESVAILRGPATMAPDLAFSEVPDATSDPSSTRDRLALSFRGDRPPPTDLVRSLLEQSAEVGLRPLLVTQVGSDHASHDELARELGIEHLGWEGHTPREQLVRVRSAYRSCSLVVSDRLHGLLMATTAGAVPIGATYRDSDKLQATLGCLIPLPLVDREAGTVPPRLLADALDGRRALSPLLAEARASLESIRRTVADSLTKGDTRGAEHA